MVVRIIPVKEKPNSMFYILEALNGTLLQQKFSRNQVKKYFLYMPADKQTVEVSDPSIDIIDESTDK